MRFLNSTAPRHAVLVDLFLQERAKKLSGVTSDASPATKVSPVKRVTVVGAGVMGGGIAQWASSRDISVILRDINHDAIAKGLAGIAKIYEQGVKRHALTKVEARAGMDLIAPSAVDVPLHSTDVIIEAAVEESISRRSCSPGSTNWQDRTRFWRATRPRCP